MNKQDWYDCGERIGDIVSDAIRDNDFSNLSENITDMINDSLEAVQESMKRAGRMQEEAKAAVSDAKSADKAQTGERSGASWRYAGNAFEESRAKAHVRPEEPGALKKTAGTLLSIVCGAAAVLLAFASIFGGSLILMGVSALVLAAASLMLRRWANEGSTNSALAKTAQRYLDAMGERDVISVDELAAATGKSSSEVRKDLKKIIREGRIAGEVYLDEEATTLMTSKQAYRAYEQARKAYSQRRAQAEESARSANTQMSDEQSQIISEGRSFIRHIHEANEQIPDKELTEKLNRLESVVTRIFEQTAAAPDSAPDLHRMMRYYLPTTQKLVDAYVELDRQQIDGEHITGTKEEIARSLDTINAAFETFLDEFFREKAWDIETDIQTLQAMMARDGLTGGGFDKTPAHSHGSAGAAAAQQEEH